MQDDRRMKLSYPGKPLVLALLALLCIPMCLTPEARGQARNLTVAVLINSSNPTYYNPDPANPGQYQRLAERYFENLQIPYQVMDVSTVAAQDLTQAQLIIAAHDHLNMPADWQTAIVTAVANGTGFLNFDSDAGIGQQWHIQQIFGATGASQGTSQQTITVPAAVQLGGAQAHYIAALQKHWLGDSPGDLTYSYHGNGVSYPSSVPTVLTGAQGTVIAELGTFPLILATTYKSGRAVDVTTLDYLHNDRFGFLEGIDDLFWRSIVWAARKPFVLRGYPHIIAIQQDDNEPGWIGRVRALYNTTYTGTVSATGTGGPWKPQGNLQLGSLADPGGERAQVISDVKANKMHVSPHGLNYGTAGDLYWNLTVPNTDAQWLTALNSVATFKAGQGGSDTFPAFGRSMVPHFWDMSNNEGYDMWNTLGLRYITTEFKPGTYYPSLTKTNGQRMQLRPFWIYELPPYYAPGTDESFPIFYADDIKVNSRQGLPAKTFFAFATQPGLMAGRFDRPDAMFPSTQKSVTMAAALNKWQWYAWHYWSGMEPVQVYTHDGDNMEYTTASDLQSFVTQMSQWYNSNGTIHMFMDEMGDYLRARTHSTLTSGSIGGSKITLNFTGNSADADGRLVATKAFIFYGDNEETLLNIPGFNAGATYTYPNPVPATIAVDPVLLSFQSVPGINPQSQTITVSNAGSGTFAWSVQSSAPWLTTNPAGGGDATPFTASVNVSGMAAGSYSATLTITATGSSNTPLAIPVTLLIAVPSLASSAPSLSFSSFVNQPAPPPQRIQITNSGGGTITWTATTNQSWLTVGSSSGPTPAYENVAVNPSALGAGIYSGYVDFHAVGATIPDLIVPVTYGVAANIDVANTSSLNGWLVSPLGRASEWTSNGTALAFAAGGESILYTGAANWADYDFEVSFTLSTAVDYPGGIRARVNPSNGGGYALWMYPTENSIKLFAAGGWDINGNLVNLGVASGIVFDKSSHKLRLSVHGTTVSAYYDGNLVLSTTDSTYSSGMVALDGSTIPLTINSAIVSSSTVPSSGLTATPSPVSFTAAYQGTNPAAQTINISAATGPVTYTASSNASWLRVAPVTGITPSGLTLTATTAGLNAGNYSATVILSPASGSAVSIPVSLAVAVPTPTLVISPLSVALQGYTGQTAPSAIVNLSNATGTAFSWTATSNQSWLTITPTGSSSVNSFTVAPNLSQLAPGSYTANITVTAPGLANSPQIIPLSLQYLTATLSDNFSNQALGWVISPNNLASGFSVANNIYSFSGIGNTQSCSGSGSWADYEFDFALQLQTASNYPGGVRARVNPTTGAGYGLWFYPAQQTIKVLNIPYWAVDGGTSLVAQATATLDTKWHSYRMVFSGSQISVYQDGNLLLTTNDSSYGAGYVCFDPSNQPIAYSSALVLSPQPPAIFTPQVTSLSFASSSGNLTPAPQSFNLSSSYPVTYGIQSDSSWLTAQVSSTTTTATVTVSASASGLANGSYTGHLTLISPSGSNTPLVIPVTFNLATGIISTTPTSLDFFSTAGSTAAPQTLTVLNSGTGGLPWSAISDSSWATLTPSSAAAPASTTVSSQASSLPAGNSVAHLTFSSPNAANGQVVVAATAHVGTLAFSDSFSSGSAQWAPSPLGLAGNWTVANNSFTYNGAGATQMYAGDPSWANYIVSAGVTLSSLNNYPGGIRGRVNPTNGASYAAWIYPANGVIKLFLVTGWSIDSPGLVLLGQSAPLPTIDTNTHILRMSFINNQITVFYDNTSVIQATDNTYPTGEIALDVSSQPIAFSNVSVLQQ